MCAKGFVHARSIDGEDEVGLRAEEAVVTASVFKIPVALELARQAATGELDLRERINVTSAERAPGPTGMSGMLDDAELSLRDLAFLMLTISDNTATDVLMARLGLDRINASLRSLGLTKTVLVGDCRELIFSLAADLGVEISEELRFGNDIAPERYEASRTLRAEETTRTTPREITRLLQLIWLDEAGPPEACREVRRIMAQQFETHRFFTAFPDEVRLSAKTGTLPGIRNEAGVVEYPDGSRFAVGVFTVAKSYELRLPAIDAAVGEAARIAVEHLRAGGGAPLPNTAPNNAG